jgi:hypothetical protein
MWTPNNHLSNRSIAVAVQRPTIHTHVYWCVCAPRRGRGTQAVLSLPQIPQADVFRAIVVRIDFVPTLALELLAVAVVFVGKPTVGVRTPLAGVAGGNQFNRDSPFWCFVFDVLDKTAKCPDMMPVSVWQPLSNIGQILKHDHIAVMFNGFRDNVVSDRVDVLFPPCSLSLPKSKQSVVSGLCATLLHLRPAFLELVNPVVILVATPERTS